MRKAGLLHILLEVITILSNIVIGVTILTFLYQGVEINKSYIGSIIMAIGVTELVEFLSMKDLVKLRNIPNAVVAVASIVLGLLFMFLNIDLPTTCVVWGICSIAFQVVKIADAGLNLIRQPFLNIFIIILCIIETIFSIFLIIKTTNSVANHLTYVGISLLVEAFLLVIEFIIHRYQKDSL